MAFGADEVLALSFLALHRDLLLLETHLVVEVVVVRFLHRERELLELLGQTRIYVAIARQLEDLLLQLAQEVLLRTKNTAWTQNADPRNEISSAEAVVLDRIDACLLYTSPSPRDS